MFCQAMPIDILTGPMVVPDSKDNPMLELILYTPFDVVTTMLAICSPVLVLGAYTIYDMWARSRGNNLEDGSPNDTHKYHDTLNDL